MPAQPSPSSAATTPAQPSGVATTKVTPKVVSKVAPKIAPKVAPQKATTRAATKAVLKVAPKVAPKATPKPPTKPAAKVAPKVAPKATPKAGTIPTAEPKPATGSHATKTTPTSAPTPAPAPSITEQKTQPAVVEIPDARLSDTTPKSNKVESRKKPLELEEGQDDAVKKVKTSSTVVLTKSYTLTPEERLALRAEKFKTNLTNETKLTLRAARFGSKPVGAADTTSATTSTTAPKVDQDTLSKRAARFGTITNPGIASTPEEKLAQRMARFKQKI